MIIAVTENKYENNGSRSPSQNRNNYNSSDRRVDLIGVIVEITITVHQDLRAPREIFTKEISTEVLTVVRNTNLSTSLDV